MFHSENRQKFLHKNHKDDLIQIGGTDITIQGAPGAVLDGNGALWWDGQGSNGGVSKYNSMYLPEGLRSANRPTDRTTSSP
jgi:polygalacturonase